MGNIETLQSKEFSQQLQITVDSVQPLLQATGCIIQRVHERPPNQGVVQDNAENAEEVKALEARERLERTIFEIKTIVSSIVPNSEDDEVAACLAELNQ